MARMIPPVIPASCPSPGEREIFTRLRDEPGANDWIVLHSLDISHHLRQIRKDELVTLTFDNIDWEQRTVIIQASNSKNGKPREIPLDDEMFDMISELRRQAEYRRPKPGWTPKMTEQQFERFSAEHVFVTQVCTPWRNNLLTRFYAVCKRAGIADAVLGGAVDIHSLRVSFTTLALEGGANPKAVQAILGHSTLALTMGVYARTTECGKREAIGALPFARVTTPDHIIPVQKAHLARTSNSTELQPVAPALFA